MLSSGWPVLKNPQGKWCGGWSSWLSSPTMCSIAQARNMEMPMHYPGKLKSGEAQRKRCPQLVLSAAVAQVASQSSERVGICTTGRGRILSFKEQARQCGVYGRNGTSWSSMIESCIDTGNQTADLRRECSSSYPDPLSRMCRELCMMPLQQDTWESPRC